MRDASLVAGAPFYADAEQDRRWGHPQLLVDVLPGAATSLSLEGTQDLHFITRTPTDPREIRIPPQRTAV